MGTTRIFLIVSSLILLASCDGQKQGKKEKASTAGTAVDTLVYSPSTMASLKHIVDSMNIKYRTCDAWKTYYSVPQAICHHIYLDTGNIKAALADIKKNISYEEFIKKYPLADEAENLLTVRSNYTDFGKGPNVRFSTVELGRTYSYVMFFEDMSLLDKNLQGRWIWEHNGEDQYNEKEMLEAFFVVSEFTSVPIPEQYAKMIQYSDCMVDTTTEVYIGNSRSDLEGSPYDKYNKKIWSFTTYANNLLERPGEREYDSLQAWADKMDSMVVYCNARHPQFRNKLNDALIEAYAKKVSHTDLEMIAAPIVSKDTLLFLKRCRRVMGGCSQDRGPIYHALHIASLSAETANWEIFLRSHLDVMNDRFQRASDGSYAEGKRKTYIAELEALDIDVTTLLFGISFQINNPAGNHYFGSISRLGRAMAESKHKLDIENQMASIIRDKTLDDYNRLAIYYLYDNYIYNLTEESEQTKSINKLKAAVTTLPPYYSDRITFEYERHPLF